MSPPLASLSLLALSWHSSAGVARSVEPRNYQNLGSCIVKEQQAHVASPITNTGKITLEQVTALVNLMSNTLLLFGYIADGAIDKTTSLEQPHGNGLTCDLDDPKFNEALSGNVGVGSTADKMDLLSDAVDSDIFNFAFLISLVLSSFCSRFLNRLLVNRKNRIPSVSRVRTLFQRKLKKKLKSKDCIDRLDLHLKVLLSPSFTDVRSRRLLSNRLHHGVKNASYEQFKGRKKSRSTRRDTSKALRAIIDNYYSLLATESDNHVLLKILVLGKQLKGFLTEKIFESRAVVDFLTLLKVIGENESLCVRFCALEIINDYLFEFDGITDDVANRSVEVFLGLLTGFRAKNGRLLGDAPFEAPRDYWEKGRHEEAEVTHVFDMLRCFIFSLDAEHLTMMCYSEDLMQVLFDGLNNEAEMDERAEEYFMESLTASTLATLLRYASLDDRAFLRGKYAEKLAQAFMKLDFQELARIMHHDDNTAFIAANSALLLHIALSIKNAYTRYETHERYRVAVALLGYGLRTSPRELERMLGLGELACLLCPAARFFSKQDDDDREQADIFRAILRAHPEFHEPFRFVTAFNYLTSHTARIGRAIPPPRRPKPGLYIILDEEVDMI